MRGRWQGVAAAWAILRALSAAQLCFQSGCCLFQALAA